MRALALHPRDFSFASGSAENIKKWSFPDGKFLTNMMINQHSIINTMSINEDGEHSLHVLPLGPANLSTACMVVGLKVRVQVCFLLEGTTALWRCVIIEQGIASKR